VGIAFISKKFDANNSLSKKFDIYSKIIFMDAGNFFRHQAELVLRHQMQVSNYFVNSFYSDSFCTLREKEERRQGVDRVKLV
jgi:hypothetical protein